MSSILAEGRLAMVDSVSSTQMEGIHLFPQSDADVIIIIIIRATISTFDLGRNKRLYPTEKATTVKCVVSRYVSEEQACA